jgi:hypothetical protein
MQLHPIAIFQATLLLFIVSTTFFSTLGLAPFAVAFALLGGLSAAFARNLPPSERRTGGYLLAAFAFFSLVVMAAWQFVPADPMSSFLILPLLTLLFFAAYLSLKLLVLSWEVECTVLGHSNGLAIVQTQPSLSSSLPSGRYVVESRPVKAGRRAVLVLQKSLFGPGKPLRLEIRAR